MRIILFTIDDIDYSPLLNKQFIERYKKDISKIYISRSLFDIKKVIKNLNFLVKNSYPFCIKFKDLFSYLRWKHINFKNKSTLDYYNNIGIDTSYVDDINSDVFIEELNSLKPDIVLFNPFDKIAKQNFLSIPSIGAYNVHLGKIPEYRGGFSSFWVLRNGDTTSGITIHELTTKIDKGNIIEELRFEHDCKSMKKLMDKTSFLASNLVVNFLEKIYNNDKSFISVNDRIDRYYMYPSYGDFNEFYKKGNVLI
tara:strand:- start:454 stop:1212 length:759 start_codon:yes stop_codon:yes gene_type:complete